MVRVFFKVINIMNKSKMSKNIYIQSVVGIIQSNPS
jgi:hypothetical protein